MIHCIICASPLDELVGQFGLSTPPMEAQEEDKPSLIVDLPPSTSLSVEDILHPDPFSIAGSFSGTVSVDGFGVVVPELQAKLFIDIRPDSWFRFFAGGQVTLPSRDVPDSSSVFSLTELFSDFFSNRSMFLRIGRQKGDWGEGRFWRRGDLLNIDGKNYKTAPLAVRYSASFASFHHVDVWALLPATKKASDNKEWGIAVSYDFSISGFAMRLGGTYRYQGVSGGTLSFSSALGPVQVSALGSVSYGYPGRPFDAYPHVYYSAGADFFWSTKPRGIFVLSGQFLAESFPNIDPDGRKVMEHGQFLALELSLRTPWQKIPVYLRLQGKARLDRFAGSWQAGAGWNPLEYLSCSFGIRGGWGDPRVDPWDFCSIPRYQVIWFLSLSISRQF